MHHIIFSTYNERADGTFRIDSQSSNPKFNCSMSLLDDYASFWKGFDPEAQIHLDPTIEGALHRARTLGDRGHGMQTFVTGSLHLVGGALSLLHPVTVDDTQSLADGT
ncbi:MAG: hypothetical protein M1818_001311 [Claussenomyces sp. TS43310]|nr:MAG: hypothetical protein M1818_001311 [Claussenomyces sp. TS43310]